MPPEPNVANPDEAQDFAIQYGTAMPAHLRIGEAVVAFLPLEARISRLLAILHAAKECLECFIQPVQDILQDLGVDVTVFWPHLFDAGKLL